MNVLPFISFSGAAACAAVAVVAAIRARRAIADWAFVAGMVALAIERWCGGMSLRAAAVEPAVAWQQMRLVTLSLLPAIWLLFSLTYARGNAGVFVAKWRVVLIAALAAPFVLVFGFQPALLPATHFTSDGTRILEVGWAAIGLYVIVLTAFVLVLMNLERTFRASVGSLRWRIKFVLLGVGVLVVVRIYTTSQVLLFRAIGPEIESVNAVGSLVAAAVLLRAMLRPGIFETDVYPSQSILQGSVTVLLAGVYLIVVGIFANVAARFGGDAGFALKALLVLVSLVLLAAILQSDRVRLYTRRFISRNFHRPQYDYRAAWQKFTEDTAACVEQADLCRAIVKLTAEIFQSLSVSLWLVNEKRDGFVLAGTSSIGSGTEGGPTFGPAATEVIRHFETKPDLVDFEHTSDPWAVTLRTWHPSQFAHGGDRVVVPLCRQKELVGLMIIGDRVGGAAFSFEDFEMLRCIASQATASLLNAQLSQRLLQAKELEAFQTMAAFFVHDLKNAASTLNLMLKNLPVHFNDPAFREDALRGIGKTVQHINGLIGRLGLLRRELRIERAARDLNEIVATTLTTFEKGAAGSRLVSAMEPVPKIPLDPEQIQKVVTNLILNATEATESKGEVRVATAHRNDWVVLTVADNGCGMPPEFIKRSLFRPFQTTKKNGLGIGMFQSRMIIEAHGGRVEVDSEPGRGTTFNVFLPVIEKSR